MQLELNRDTATDVSTTGTIHVDGEPECFTLEGPLRWPSEDQTKAAIPPGQYAVVLDFSTRFQRIMPHVLDVPGRSGIRIHAGNTAADTSGCILVGRSRGPDAVYESRVAFDALVAKIAQALQGDGRCWLAITEIAAP